MKEKRIKNDQKMTYEEKKYIYKNNKKNNKNEKTISKIKIIITKKSELENFKEISDLRLQYLF